MKAARAIEISFAVPVELTDQDQLELMGCSIASAAATRRANPHRVMWVFGIGCKMLANPLALSDDEPIPFDESVLSFECAERENYEWPCAKCGRPQGDHKTCITQPPAGACDYVPASKLQAEPAKGNA